MFYPALGSGALACKQQEQRSLNAFKCGGGGVMKRLDTMNIIEQLEAEQAQAIEAKRQLPPFSPGDTVRVLVRVTEGSRTRVQAYEGVCIARKGSGINESFTVRKISYGRRCGTRFPRCILRWVEGVEGYPSR